MLDIIPKEGYQFINSFFYSQDSSDRGTNLDLMLIKNKSINEDIQYSDLIELDATSYSRIELIDSNWNISTTKASYTRQVFTVGVEDIFSEVTGYAIVTKGTSPKILSIGLNKYGSINVSSEGEFAVTPQIYNTTKNKMEEQPVWSPPSYWLDLPEPSGDNEFYILVAIGKNLSNEAYLFLNGTCPTVLVDWGDGSPPESVAVGGIRHTYDFDNPNLGGTETPEGYKQAIISVSKDSVGDLTTVRLYGEDRPNLFMDVTVRCSTITTLQLPVFNFFKRLKVLGSSSLSSLNISSGSIESVEIEDLSSFTSLAYLFANCPSLVDITIPTNYSGITSVQNMFSGCRNLKRIPELNTTGVTNFRYMFNECISLEEAPVLDTSSATDINFMFANCRSLKKVPFYDFSSVLTMESTFYFCYQLSYLPSFDLSSVTSLSNCFRSCSSLKVLPDYDFSSVEDISYMVESCFSLKEIKSYSFPSALDISYLFQNCYALEKVGSLSFPQATNCNRFFYNTYSLRTIESVDIPLALGNEIFQNAYTLINVNSIDISVLENLNLFTNTFLQRFNITSISKSFTITDSKLSSTSLIEIFNGLDDLTATTYQTVTISNTWGTDNLLSTDIEIATNKNWEVIIDSTTYPPTPP